MGYLFFIVKMLEIFLAKILKITIIKVLDTFYLFSELSHETG